MEPALENVFLFKKRNRVSLTIATEGCSPFFVNLFRCENVGSLVSMTVYKPRLFHFFQITLSKPKSLKHSFVDIGK